MGMSDSQRFPLNPYLIKNVKDIAVFLDKKCLILILFSSINAQVIFVVKPQLKNNQNYKH